MAYLGCTFISITTATENNALPRASRLDFELEDLIYAGSILPTEGDLIFPESNRVVLKVLFIFTLESLNRRLHLLLKLEENMASEALA